MKTLLEYIEESKKTYSLRVKIAGELESKFTDTLKNALQRYDVVSIEAHKTPVQASPIDFPNISNVEVNIFDIVTNYPITPQIITNDIRLLGINESNILVYGATGDEDISDEEESDEESKALMNDPNYSEVGKVNYKDYFGDEYNKSFLKSLSKSAKERDKDIADKQKRVTKIEKNKNKEGIKSPLSQDNRKEL